MSATLRRRIRNAVKQLIREVLAEALDQRDEFNFDGRTAYKAIGYKTPWYQVDPYRKAQFRDVEKAVVRKYLASRRGQQ